MGHGTGYIRGNFIWGKIKYFYTILGALSKQELEVLDFKNFLLESMASKTNCMLLFSSFLQPMFGQ